LKPVLVQVRVLSTLLLWFVATIVSAQPAIFIVRHAEKAVVAGKDPDLSERGHRRANELAKMLKDAGIGAIYVTEFKRTQQTAAPLATMLGTQTTILPANDLKALISKLRDLKGNALVIGHTNTIPDVIKSLGVAPSITIGESDYDDLFVVFLEEEPRLIRLHYHP
jgi:phosphohistidine phosphatase SixA